MLLRCSRTHTCLSSRNDDDNDSKSGLWALLLVQPSLLLTLLLYLDDGRQDRSISISFNNVLWFPPLRDSSTTVHQSVTAVMHKHDEIDAIFG